MLSDKRRERYRENLGALLKQNRIKEGYTQKALANELGLEYYTMISQMELGYIAIPASLWLPIAQILKIDAAEWVLNCLVEYQPEVYTALFRNRELRESSKVLTLFHKGDLEDILNDLNK